MSHEQQHESAVASVEKHCAKSPHGLSIRRVEVVKLGERVSFTEEMLESMKGGLSGEVSFRVDSIQVIDLASNQGDLRLLVPWSGNWQMPHEIYSIVAGHLPWSVALKQDYGAVLRKWTWEKLGGAGSSALADALGKLGKAMYGDVPVSISAGNATIEVAWAIQAVPMDEKSYVFAAQSGPRLLGPAFDLDSYLEKRARFAVVLEETTAITGPATFQFAIGCYTESFIKEQFPEVVARRMDNRVLEVLETARRLLEHAKFQQAARSAEDALGLDPENAEGLRLRDEAKARLAEVERLTKEAALASRRKDFDAAAAANERLLVLFEKDKQKSREFKTALDQVNVDRVRVLFQAAQALSKESGKNDEAVAKLRALLVLKPNHQMARDLLAKLGG